MKQDNLFISNFKLILRLSIFVTIMIAILIHFGQKYEKAAEHNVINAFTKSRFDDFYALTPGELDMVFLGSSHSYCTFDPENFDEKMQISSFQLGTPLQHPDTTYFTLKEVLKTQKPSVAVVEVYWDMLDESFEMKQANSFFEVVNDENTVKEYIKEVFPINEKVKYSILPIKYQQDYFAYEGSQIEKQLQDKYNVTKKKTASVEGKEEYRSKGYVYCDYVIPEEEFDETNQFKNFDGENWDFNKVQKKYLKKIIELCKDEDIELIFVTAPIANVSMDYIKNYDLIYNDINKFAQENNIKYIDLNKICYENNLLKDENFRDDAHLNDSGVKIVNNIFMEFLLENSEKLSNN